MIEWMAANAATIIITMVLVALGGAAARSVYKNRGTCSCGSGSKCGGCSGCCGHSHQEKS